MRTYVRHQLQQHQKENPGKPHGLIVLTSEVTLGTLRIPVSTRFIVPDGAPFNPERIGARPVALSLPRLRWMERPDAD